LTGKYEAPSLGNTGYNCPHCAVRSVQVWATLYSRHVRKGQEPRAFSQEDLDYWRKKKKDPDSSSDPALIASHIERLISGEVFLEKTQSDVYANIVNNLHLAICAHCEQLSIWLAGTMVYPLSGEIAAHEDLPVDVKRTFSEASKISDISPRASAALSRLALQELCVTLECKTTSLNDQVGELIARGLNPDIGQMLDAVRVIGNNAVHPGEIDLKDDQETARFLLNCINRICQRMITEKLEAQKLFDDLPKGARDAIERRNAKLLPAPTSSNTKNILE
jgi:hypothetical protein